MAKAKITCKDGFSCAPKGHTTIHYPYGETVDGVVADWACKAQVAKRLKPKYNSKQLNPKLENK